MYSKHAESNWEGVVAERDGLGPREQRAHARGHVAHPRVHVGLVQQVNVEVGLVPARGLGQVGVGHHGLEALLEEAARGVEALDRGAVAEGLKHEHALPAQPQLAQRGGAGPSNRVRRRGLVDEGGPGPGVD